MKELIAQYNKAVEDKTDADKRILRMGREIVGAIQEERNNDNHLILGQWDCDKSPTGKCVYDIEQKYNNEDCIYCGEPDENFKE